MAVDTMIFDKLYNIIFGDQQQAWAEADDAGRQQMLEDEGLDQLTPEDLHEAVTLMSEELPPEQVSLLAPSTTSATAQAAATTALADQDVSNADTTVQSGPVINQEVAGDTTVAGGNVGGVSQVDASTAASPVTSGPVSAPAPAPAPAPAAAAPTPPPAPPVVEAATPIEAVTQTINYYVTNVTNNVDQSTTNNIDDRDTEIDNSVEIEGDVFAEEFEIENTTQTAGDGSVQLGEDANVTDSQIATDGAIAADGSVEGAITGEVTDSTVVQGDVSGGTVTGDVEGAVLGEGAEATGLNTGEVGGDMITNTGSDANFATNGSEINDLDSGGGDLAFADDGSEAP